MIRLRHLGAFALAIVITLTASVPARSATFTKAPLDVGMAFALTGFLADLDGRFIDGIKLAVKVANDAGGIDGHEVRLHIVDNASNAGTGVTATNQLLNQFGVTVMINGVSSGQNAAIEPIVARAKVPMLIFSVLPPDPVWAFDIALLSQKVIDVQLAFVKEHAHGSKIAIVYSQTPYGQVGAKLMADSAQRMGLSVVSSVAVEGNVTDMTPQMATIKDAGPDAVVDVLTGSTHIVEAKAAATVGMHVPLVFAGDDIATVQKATAAYPETYVAATPPQAYPHVRDAKLKAAYERFLREFQRAGLNPAEVADASFGWDAVQVLAQAIKNSGATGGDALRSTLETTTVQGSNSLLHITAADHTGQATVPNEMQIGQMQGNTLTIVYTPRSQ